MTLRSCVYKNCENYINLKDRTVNDVKLFSFPKNPERRQKWMELGKVPPNLPESMYYLCSDHFDKKFFAVNNRRTVLVGEAVPFPFVETGIEESYEDTDGNLDYYLYEINRGNAIVGKQEFLDEQDLHVESTTVSGDIQDNINVEHLSNDLDEQESNECIVYTSDSNQESSITYCNKRKLDNTVVLAEAGTSNAKILKKYPLQKPLGKLAEKNLNSLQQISCINGSSGLRATIRSPNSCKGMHDDEIDVDQLVNTKNVTTFIFKGEEYIQMPKEVYINEKLELMQNLRNMERTLKAIKGHLNALDI